MRLVVVVPTKSGIGGIKEQIHRVEGFSVSITEYNIALWAVPRGDPKELWKTPANQKRFAENSFSAICKVVPDPRFPKRNHVARH
jgi:hypothetical protein